jgi:uncharacterized protein YgiM (DUF1202 family)
MKKVLLIITSLVLTVNLWGQLNSTTQKVNLRGEPNTNGLIITVVPSGTLVNVIEENEGWSKVSLNKDTGYIYSSYLKTFNPDNSSTSPEKIHYYKNSQGEKVQSPTNYKTAPAGATAECRDGTYSFSRNRRGTCSHHGGVKRWMK